MNHLCLILPLARRTDPATSHAAVNKAARIAPSQRNIILSALREHPRSTVYSLEAETGIAAHAIGKRMIELQRLGLAAPTGEVFEGCRKWHAL